MAIIIEKRREAKNYMRRVCEALKFAEDEIQQLEENNDEHLAKMISLLEDSGARVNEPELTAECFAKKVDRYTEMIAQDVIQFEDSCLAHVQNTKIFVQFKNQDGKCLLYGFPLFDSGFSSAGGQQDRHRVRCGGGRLRERRGADLRRAGRPHRPCRGARRR